ncbi:MAG: hypothetical protein ACE5MK_01220, partial [Acidobacteriota bacterium]
MCSLTLFRDSSGQEFEHHAAIPEQDYPGVAVVSEGTSGRRVRKALRRQDILAKDADQVSRLMLTGRLIILSRDLLSLCS